jgi:hypothetical protein
LTGRQRKEAHDAPLSGNAARAERAKKINQVFFKPSETDLSRLRARLRSTPVSVTGFHSKKAVGRLAAKSGLTRHKAARPSGANKMGSILRLNMGSKA